MLALASTGAITGKAEMVAGGILANMSDPGPNPGASYSTLINWGDNTPETIGLVVGHDGSYSVAAAHVYASPGNYTCTIKVLRFGTFDSGMVTSPVSIS